MTDNLCAHSTRRWRQKAMTGRAEGGRYRRECAPRSRYFQADQRYVAARLCSCVFGLGHLRLLAALCAIPPIAVLAQGTAVPLVGSHGAAGLVRLIVTLMPIALLLPHAGPASSGRHAVALMTGRHQAESKMRPATLSYQSSLDLQRLPRARINNLHTTFAYHIPIPLQKESIILIYRYHTGKCRTLHTTEAAHVTGRRRGRRQRDRHRQYAHMTHRHRPTTSLGCGSTASPHSAPCTPPYRAPAPSPRPPSGALCSSRLKS